MPRKHSDLLLSRRDLMRALGATAIAGLPGYGAAGVGPPSASTAKIIDGYTDQQSYRPGDPVTLFLNAAAPQRAVMYLYDYTGRRVYEFSADLFPQKAVGPKPWETGFGYRASVSFTLPRLPSGVYLVEGLIPLIVKPLMPLMGRRGPARHAEVVIVYPTNTVAAYTSSGGKSMYSAPTPAPIVSFHRPAGPATLNFFSAFLEWFASIQFPYSVGYLADIDLEDYNEISGSKVLVVIGHSEYWTRRARENFDQFVLDGGNALLLSGNNMWWQARYSDDHSQLICYKRAHDPVADPLLRTINWPTPSLNYPTLLSIGADFPHGGFGIAYPDKGSGFRVLSPTSPVFRGLFIRSGDLLSMPTVEYDGAPLLNNPVTVGAPRLNLSALGAFRAEIIGYQHCARNDTAVGVGSAAENVGTWLVYQRTGTSGVVMNGASTNWCSRTGAFGSDGFRIRAIILNMLEILVKKESAFVS